MSDYNKLLEKYYIDKAINALINRNKVVRTWVDTLKDLFPDKEDTLGGLILLGGAGFYGLNIAEAFIQGNIVGVNLKWALYFIFVNVVYCRIFYKNGLPWSFYGSIALALTESIYAGQIIYYG